MKTTIEVTEALTLRRSENTDDWFLIERLNHDGRNWFEPIREAGKIIGQRFMCSSRIGNADIEGSADHMRAIAAAIRDRSSDNFKRCAVNTTDSGVELWSPRNSEARSLVSQSVADALAADIDRVLSEAGNGR